MIKLIFVNLIFWFSTLVHATDISIHHFPMGSFFDSSNLSELWNPEVNSIDDLGANMIGVIKAERPNVILFDEAKTNSTADENLVLWASVIDANLDLMGYATVMVLSEIHHGIPVFGFCYDQNRYEFKKTDLSENSFRINLLDRQTAKHFSFNRNRF